MTTRTWVYDAAPVEAGQRVRLVHTNDEYTKLERGSEGTVRAVTDFRPTGGMACTTPGGDVVVSEFQIAMRWDDGSTLFMLMPPDELEVIT